jgi:hypothetical protein
MIVTMQNAYSDKISLCRTDVIQRKAYLMRNNRQKPVFRTTRIARWAQVPKRKTVELPSAGIPTVEKVAKSS